MAGHNWGTLLELIANAHLGVCFPADVCAWLEYPCYAHHGQDIVYPSPLADEILAEPLAVEGSYLRLPDRPVLGVEIDETVIDHYPYLPGHWGKFLLYGRRARIPLSGDHVPKWD